MRMREGDRISILCSESETLIVVWLSLLVFGSFLCQAI